MSGGSYNYAYHHVDDVADQIEARLDTPPVPQDLWPGTQEPLNDSPVIYDNETRRWLTPEESAPIFEKINSERRWFAGLLKHVAKAMHDIEWVDSCDYSEGRELQAIEVCRNYLKQGDV